MTEPMDQRFCNESADPANIVIFGATGDLTMRKLMPALVRMVDCGLMHPQSRIIGVVRDMSSAAWLQLVRDGLAEFSPEVGMDEDRWQAFSALLKMVPGDLEDETTYTRLAESLEQLGDSKNAMFYCAIPPKWYRIAARGLNKAGLTAQDEGYRRLVIEKPFGMDLDSARELSRELQSVIDESQIYRIDHYLGKESVQNLLVYRFANSIMEPLWNRNYIDHIQISVSETLGIEYRAKYYENAGALRDMIQSHLMQMMTLVAMEPPVEFTAHAVRDEKMKVLRAVRRFEPQTVSAQVVAAQYAAGRIDGEDTLAYVREDGVAPDSATETFAAVRFQIDNWRWQGVPFILWSGKRMEKKVSEVMIRFRKPPFNLFDTHASAPAANALVFRLQPDAGVVLRMNAKQPGLTTDIQRLVMRAPYADDDAEVADAYEILMHDVLTGDGTLFSRSDEVEESWEIVEPILQAWKDRFSIGRYRAGTWDIPAMDTLTRDCVGGWHTPS
ncbi:MAG: glucose-6-phosphate dehydrogenase [Gammaproteobacteria bacterium]|nr:glucose-6-phosphate dehydrogenase [Gammaproteobacteria bacterium]MDH3560019.1 glucose-6-phosphate dehydrogenase [Gammaproteobacteria bacterium]